MSSKLSKSSAMIALALCIASGVMLSACAPEEDALPEDPTTEEVGALTKTDSTRTWHQVTGLLVDIATANGPASRWGIDTNFGQTSFGQSGFRVVKWSGDKWAATAGRGVRIALRGTGDANRDGISDVFAPWVVTSNGQIWRADNIAGSTWTRLPDLNAGVTAVDIGSGGSVGNMAMWCAGSDGRVYQFIDANNQWRQLLNSPLTGNPLLITPNNVIRVSGPVRTLPGIVDEIELVALTSWGEVWLFVPNSRDPWLILGSEVDPFRTDVSSEGSLMRLAFSDGFLTSTMVTSAKAGDANRVRTFRPDDTFSGPAAFIWTGPYAVSSPFGSLPIGSAPLAVSSDVDRHRVWIVTANNRVYYGE